MDRWGYATAAVSVLFDKLTLRGFNMEDFVFETHLLRQDDAMFFCTECQICITTEMNL